MDIRYYIESQKKHKDDRERHTPTRPLLYVIPVHLHTEAHTQRQIEFGGMETSRTTSRERGSQ